MLQNLLEMLTSVILILLYIRFFLQFADIRRFDPYAMPAYKATSFVDAFTRIFPDLAKGRISLAALMLMLLVKLIFFWGEGFLLAESVPPIGLFFKAAFDLAYSMVNVCFYLVMGSVILSWVVMLTQSMHPIISMVMQMAEPIIAPFRRIAPDLGMIDISPIFAFFVLMLLQKVLARMQGYFTGMF